MHQEDLFGVVHNPAPRGVQGDLFPGGVISAEEAIAKQRKRLDAAREEATAQRLANQIPGQVDIVDAVAEVERESATQSDQEPGKAAKVFRVRGATDDVTECERCGRPELKGTVVLEVLDADENGTGELVYYGSSCGAKAAGWTTKHLKDEVRRVAREKLEAEIAEKQRQSGEWIAARDAWIAENIGPDALTNPRKYGYAYPTKVVRAYCEATGS